ncbi:hypothetical protein LNP26_20340 [Klebsiella variicola subsp. variicola]|nr:hypothetical protein [Klebsiella variicola subsp. variicola]
MKDIIMPEAGELYLLPKRENNWHLNNVVNELRRVRQAWRDEHAKNNYRNKRSLPSRESVNSVADTLIKVLYPMRLGDVDLRKEGKIITSAICWAQRWTGSPKKHFWNSIISRMSRRKMRSCCRRRSDAFSSLPTVYR